MANMETNEFLCDLGLMYDTLEEIAHLSLTLQERGMTLTKADKLMRRTIRLISYSYSRQEALTAAERLEFCGIFLTTSVRIRQIDSTTFLQSLIGNLEDRLMSVCSSKGTGVVCIKQLAQFRLDPRRVLEGFRDYKEDSSIIPEDLSPLINILSLIPMSSAECEQGFS
ncbi:hypothetical protein N1851_031256 [Merluccius polli]|uniref:HAT C-terminal dimerisation domain-containing protein n=1 Tax=Merluccius polli TaxID=89951 RepID=A0AA47M416_MERPO|nr:hypothetical protein N1851_031256 [Merluccius polli]